METEQVDRPVVTYLTTKLQLRDLSQRKRALLLDAMRRAHLAFDKLMRKFQPEAEEIAALPKSERRRALIDLRKPMSSYVKPMPLGNGPKQAIVKDALSQIESFAALKDYDAATTYPTSPRLRGTTVDREGALERLASSTTLEEENAARDDLMRESRPPRVRPLSIYKNRPGDGALIVADNKGRLFTYVNLLPRNARRARPVVLEGLVDIRTGEIMSGRYGSGALLPISLGGWQRDKFLKAGTMQSAKLKYDEAADAFFLIATFKYEAEAVEPENLLGVNRGYDPLAAWTVTDCEGNPIASGRISGDRLRSVQRSEEKRQRQDQKVGRSYSSRTRKVVADEETHKAANVLAELALQHNARVVFEDLAPALNGPQQRRPKGAPKRSWTRRLLTRTQFSSLAAKTAYRLSMLGHRPVHNSQPYITVHPAANATTCPACGHAESRNREVRGLLVCAGCGSKFFAEEAEAAVIAAKGGHFTEVVQGRTKGKKLTEEEKFTNWYKQRGHRAGNGFRRSVPGLDCSQIAGEVPGYGMSGPKHPDDDKSGGASSPKDGQQPNVIAIEAESMNEINGLDEDQSRP